MAIYSVGRRRVIIALLLTSALLLTLDLRGNAVLDRVRDGFSRVMQPVEDATEVATSPIERAWNSYSNYDDLEQENQTLRDQLDRLIGSQAAAEASVIDYQLLLALNNLPSLGGIDTEVAKVVGASSNNLDQIVEINKGRNAGIAVGMPVVNQAGLIGRVTSVTDNAAQVMLITDRRYSVAVEIVGDPNDENGPEPPTTTPSGRTDDEIDEIIDQATDPSTPTTTNPADVLQTDSTLPQSTESTLPLDPALPPATTLVGQVATGDQPVDTEVSVDEEVADDPTAPTSTTSTTTTTTTTPAIPDRVEKEFGVLEGRGESRLPQIRFLQDIPSLAVLQEGDLVETAGGASSLAPPDIPIGQVVNRADRPGVAGPILEVELYADLGELNFVRVVLFRPLSEVEQ